MVANISTAVNRLIEHWKQQKLKVINLSSEQLIEIEKEKEIALPDDFKTLFTSANGMRTVYQQDMDIDGFYFYSLQELSTFEEEIGVPRPLGCDQIYIFAEYMHKSWWYGFEKKKGLEGYFIGIISSRNEFNVITDSLADFINLYIDGSPNLYPVATGL